MKFETELAPDVVYSGENQYESDLIHNMTTLILNHRCSYRLV